MKDLYSELVKAAGLPALKLLCELLKKAIQFSPHQDEDAEDFSYIWRRAIEDHPQNLGHTVKDALVSAVRDAAELLVKSSQAFIESVEFLRSWKPPTSVLFEPSPEGLGRVLQEVVAEEPQRFAKEAERFKGLDPTYVRALISGLEKALKQQKNFEWSPDILQVCSKTAHVTNFLNANSFGIWDGEPINGASGAR